MNVAIKFVFISAFALFVYNSSADQKNSSITLTVDGKSQSYDTLDAAVNASRKHGTQSGKTIALGAGKTFLEEALVLDEKDAGLTIQSKEGAKAELIGGRKITGWKKEGEFWTAPAPGTKNGSWNFRTLLVNGKSAPRARYPETGRLKNLNKWSVRWMSTAEGGWQRKPNQDELTRMVYKEGDLGSWLDLENAELTIFHKWDETLVGVKKHDPENHTVIFSNHVGHPLGAFGVKDYVVWNVKKGMTRAGQWYLDRIKEQVVYWPRPDESIDTLTVVTPVLEHVIRLERAEKITLRDLHIQATTTPLIVGDFGAKMFDGAISARDAYHCIFENLEISGVTGWGLKLFGDNLTVKNCHIHHVGAGAIRLIGSHALIENNHLHDVGQVYPSAIALYVGVTDPNMKDEWDFGKDETHAVLRHNEIHDGPYIGIGIGGSHHVVEYNKVYRVMKELKDGSGIYATFCGKMKMRNNVVRDISGGGQNHAYYLDELSDDAVLENNISIGVDAASHNHMANNNLYRNNIFISKGPLKVTLPRCTSHTYGQNIFVSDASVTFIHPKILKLENNLFQAPKVMEQTTARYKKGKSQTLKMTGGNQIGKAGLIINGDDISFAPDSPAHAMGIKPIKGSQAGLKEE